MTGTTRRTLFKRAAVGAAAATAGLRSLGGNSAYAATPQQATTASSSSGVTGAAANGTPSSINTTLAQQTGWYLPSDWGQNWRAKLNAAKAGNGLAVGAVVGDSIGFGYWASNLFSTSWLELLRNNLTNLAGYGGSGFQSQAHSPLVMYNPLSGVPAYYKNQPGNVWTQSSGWATGSAPYAYGPGNGSIVCTSSGSTLFNYYIGTTLGIWYTDGGGNFTVQIDGTTVGTVTVGSTNKPAHVTFAAPNNKSDIHSWQITGTYNSSTKAGTSILGVEGLNTTGVRLDNFSFPGLTSRTFANQDGPYYSGTYAGGFNNPADLIIYEVAGDDIGGGDPNYPNGTPADVWVQNVQTYFDGVMNNTFGGNALGKTDVLFLFPVANISVDKNSLYLEYKSRAIGLAQTYGAALFDLNAIFHTSWNAWQQAGYAGNQSDPTKSGTDSNHPSDAGSQVLANSLIPLLSALS